MAYNLLQQANSAMTISKSDYMLFLKHPAWLWLKKHAPDKLPPIDDNTQAIFDQGKVFEAYAEKLFPDLIKVGFNNPIEYKTIFGRTQKTIKSDAQIIAQAGFEVENLVCICDILVKMGENKFDLYEIKSGTKAKEEYELDLAFQLVVLEKLGYKIGKIFVIHLNTDYIRNGEIDHEEITKIADVTKGVKSKKSFTKKKIKEAIKSLEVLSMPDLSPSLASQEHLSDWLEIFRNLNILEPYSIYDLCAPKIEQFRLLEDMGVSLLEEIPDDFSKIEKQKNHILINKAKEEKFSKVEIQKFLESLEYPLYFLDYETLAHAIPYFDGLSPYQQLPFQYSVHIMDSPDSELRQVSYLHKENSNPTLQLAKSLQDAIGPKGSVIVWYQNFEKSCNTLLGELAPEYREFFEDINSRIVDLMTPYKNGWHNHRDFKGSASIKNVLPVLVPELSYKLLNIHDGQTAQRMWMESVLDGKRDDEKEKILADLEKYCGLDTLAMVEILKKISTIFEEVSQ